MRKWLHCSCVVLVRLPRRAVTHLRRNADVRRCKPNQLKKTFYPRQRAPHLGGRARQRGYSAGGGGGGKHGGAVALPLVLVCGMLKECVCCHRTA